MADLTSHGRDNALANMGVRKLFGASETAGQDITTSKSITGLNPGDFVTFGSTQEFFVASGETSATASATSVPFPPGYYDFCVPNGVGAVAIFGANASQKGHIWKS